MKVDRLGGQLAKSYAMVQHMRIGPIPRHIHHSVFLRGDGGERREDHWERERGVVVDPLGDRLDRVCLAGAPENRQVTSGPKSTRFQRSEKGPSWHSWT